MRNVVVTGGSRGIGLAIATTLAAGGYRAIAIARTESEELRCAIAAGDGQGGAVSFRGFDLSDSAAIAGLVGSLREGLDRKSTRLNSRHPAISYAVFCLEKNHHNTTRLSH